MSNKQLVSIQRELANRAFNLRQFHQLSRTGAANKLNLSFDTIRRLENPRSGQSTTFKLSTLTKVAKGYDVEVKDLIKG